MATTLNSAPGPAGRSLAPSPWRLVPGEALPGRHHRHEIHADEARPGLGLALERVEIEAAGRLVRDHGVGHALFADQRGERAGVDAGEPDDAAAFQPGIEMARRAVVRRLGDRGMQHDAARAGRRREIDGLDVLVVGADIADMGKREGDDLPGIGRIGEDLLIAGHRGVEADFADGMAGGAEADAFEHGAVGQHQQRRRLGFVPERTSRRSLRLCRHRQGPKSCARLLRLAPASRAGRSRVIARGLSRVARRYQQRPERGDESRAGAPRFDAAADQCRDFGARDQRRRARHA